MRFQGNVESEFSPRDVKNAMRKKSFSLFSTLFGEKQRNKGSEMWKDHPEMVQKASSGVITIKRNQMAKSATCPKAKQRDGKKAQE